MRFVALVEHCDPAWFADVARSHKLDARVKPHRAVEVSSDDYAKLLLFLMRECPATGAEADLMITEA